MNNRYTYVRPVEFETFDTFVTRNNLFAYNPKGRMPWLQRLLFKALNWLEAFYVERVPHVTAHEISLDQLSQMMVANHAARVESIIGTKAEIKYLLVGRDEWVKLANDTSISSYPIHFDIPKNYQPPGRFNSYMIPIAGLRVIRVPWMKGMVVLPELSEM